MASSLAAPRLARSQRDSEGAEREMKALERLAAPLSQSSLWFSSMCDALQPFNQSSELCLKDGLLERAPVPASEARA